MGAGALSDPKVVKASANVVPILVDCTQPGANRTLLDNYQVRGFPTLLFVRFDGEPLGRPHRRDAASLIHLMEQLAPPQGKPTWPALVAFIGISVAVIGSLVLIYKKWFAATAEEET